ncbi:MAG: hypothetical protein WCW40_05635 [Bacteroidota bacterium]
MRRLIVLSTCLMMMVVLSSSQSNREKRMFLNEYVAPEELVSMSKSLAFDKAILLFSDFSKKYMNKIIVDVSNNKKPIGVDVENTYWYQAFENVLRTNSMWYDEREEFFYVYSVKDSQNIASGTVVKGGIQISAAVDSAGKVLLRQRDVKISSVFFSVDVTKSRNAGINWKFLSGDKTSAPRSIGVEFNGGVTDPNAASGSGGSSGGSGGSSGSGGASSNVGFLGRYVPDFSYANISALIAFFASTGLGEVLSNPSITVSSGKVGRIQIGQDIYIDTKDFSGNVIKTAVSSGIIIDVKPTVYEESGIKFINLDIKAEKSAVAASGAINKATATTFSVLYDGEETIIGGLYTNSDDVKRGGIPGLKDLPWWVFGLRYIFGYDQTTTITQEIIILIKADIIPTIEERIAAAAAAKAKSQNLIEQAQKQNQSEYERLRPKK